MHQPSVELDLTTLRHALGAVLDEIQHRYGTRIDLAVDHYTTIHVEDAFRAQVPTSDTWTLGQITDDLNEMDAMLARADDPAEALNPWHDLDHLTGILRALARLDSAHGTDRALGRASDPGSPA